MRDKREKRVWHPLTMWMPGSGAWGKAGPSGKLPNGLSQGSDTTRFVPEGNTNNC